MRRSWEQSPPERNRGRWKEEEEEKEARDERAQRRESREKAVAASSHAGQQLLLVDSRPSDSGVFRHSTIT